MLKRLFMYFTQDLKLRSKLLVIYMFLTVVPIIIVGEYSYSQSEAFMLNEAIKSLEKGLTQVAEDLNYKLELCFKISDVFYLNKQLRQILATDYNNNIQEYIILYIDFIKPTFGNYEFDQSFDIRVYTPNTTLIFDRSNILSIENIASNPYYTKVINEETSPIWLPVQQQNDQKAAGTENKKFLILSRGIFHYDKKLLGVLDVCLPLDTINKVLSNIKLPHNGSGVYVNPQGQIITSFGDNKNFVPISIIEEVIQSNRAQGYIEVRDNMFIFKKTSMNGSFIIVNYPQQYIREQIQMIRHITRWTVLISSIVVLFMSSLLSKVITKRLDRLMYKIKMIRDTGKTNTDIIIQGNDEIASIDKMFNIMLSRITELTQKEIKAEITKKVMQIKILQEQINPHFLYNSLSSIKWALDSPRIKDVHQIIDSLARFYRLSLNRGREIVTVNHELQIIEEYIRIQQFTYDSNFDVIWDIEEEVREQYCIKLILQPFVENAILHGLNHMKSGGYLKITACMEEKTIVFIIEDNGKGFDVSILPMEEPLQQPFQKGFGIYNARKRIQLVYGREYDIKIQSQISVGTKVIIEIPRLSLEELQKRLEPLSY